MKAILVALVLVVLGATVFFFGWTQIKIEDDEVAVIFTKTRGWENETISPGTFSWRWERLIPTNLKLYTFDVSPRTAQVSANGMLPGAETYKQVFDTPPDFTYELAFAVRYRIRTDLLPELAADQGLKPEGLESWYDHIEGLMLDVVVESLEEASGSIGNGGSAGFVASSMGPGIQTDIESSISHIEVLSVTPKIFSFPDYRLFEEARTLYFSTLNVRNATVNETLRRATEEKVNQELKLDVLERYGELLTKYPVLLDYLALDNVDLSEVLPNMGAFAPQE